MRAMGGASRWWLRHSLAALDADLRKHGARLDIFAGAARPVLEKLVKRTGANALYWTRRYDKAGIAVDKSIKAALGAAIEVESFNGKLLVEP